jgi:hypothetical protein
VNKTHKLTIMVELPLARKLARIAEDRHCSGAQIVREWLRRANEIQAALDFGDKFAS